MRLYQFWCYFGQPSNLGATLVQKLNLLKRHFFLMLSSFSLFPFHQLPTLKQFLHIFQAKYGALDKKVFKCSGTLEDF